MENGSNVITSEIAELRALEAELRSIPQSVGQLNAEAAALQAERDRLADTTAYRDVPFSGLPTRGEVLRRMDEELSTYESRKRGYRTREVELRGQVRRLRDKVREPFLDRLRTIAAELDRLMLEAEKKSAELDQVSNVAYEFGFLPGGPVGDPLPGYTLFRAPGTIGPQGYKPLANPRFHGFPEGSEFRQSRARRIAAGTLEVKS